MLMHTTNIRCVAITVVKLENLIKETKNNCFFAVQYER